MATQTQRPASTNTPARKPQPQRAPVRKANTGAARQTPNGVARSTQQRAAPVSNKAASVAGGDNAANAANAAGSGSAYSIMASRIANRVAEMAESITFVEKPKPADQPAYQNGDNSSRRPRKLEMRLPNGGGSAAESVKFSAPFLDNTLQKMLDLQNRMLKMTGELSKTEGVDERVLRENASQSAELSRIIAMICAEKARQGA